jgi:hypothetical protein
MPLMAGLLKVTTMSSLHFWGGGAEYRMPLTRFRTGRAYQAKLIFRAGNELVICYRNGLAASPACPSRIGKFMIVYLQWVVPTAIAAYLPKQ